MHTCFYRRCCHIYRRSDYEQFVESGPEAVPELPDKRDSNSGGSGSGGEGRKDLPPTPPPPGSLSLRHKFGTAPGGSASWLRQPGGATPRGEGADTFRIGTGLEESGGGGTPVGALSLPLDGAGLLLDSTPSVPALPPLLSARSLPSARGSGGEAAAAAGGGSSSSGQVGRWASAAGVASGAGGSPLLAPPTQATPSRGAPSSSSAAAGQQPQPGSISAAANGSSLLSRLRPKLPAVFKRSGK